MLRCVLAVWAALPFIVLSTSGLTVDSASPDALCPPLEEARRAVAARLGNVELDGTWHASYVLVHRANGDFVTLTLVDPDGTVRLERELPARGSNCKALPAVIAAVLERFFVPPDQGTSEGEAAPASASTEPPIPAPVAPVLASVTIASPPVATTIRDRAVPFRAVDRRPVTRVGAELWLTNAWLAPSVRVHRRVATSWTLGAHVGFDLASHHVNVAEGSATLTRIPLSLVLAHDAIGISGFHLRGGLELVGSVEYATTTRLARNNGGWRIVPGAGVRLGASWLENRTVSPFLEVAAAWLAGAATPEFRAGDEVFAPPHWIAGGAFGLDLGFF